MATIAAIEAIVVSASPKTNWTFVAVTDGEGATGWGECSAASSEATTCFHRALHQTWIETANFRSRSMDFLMVRRSGRRH
jgi:L-alanine-DL-glutamate epimerase-like enolase superfamily enzyme